VGQTETKYNTLNPDFDRPIKVSYIFEQRQFVRFDVYDEDDRTQHNDDFIGSVTSEMSLLMGSPKQTLVLDLADGSKKATGKLITKCEAGEEGSRVLRLTFRGLKLANTDSWFDFWDKSDPYLKFIKLRADGSKFVVHTTEIIQNDLNPRWKPFEVSLQLLAEGSRDAPFLVECWDEEVEAAHQFIGEATLSLAEL
jgi:Ca2+-dependent lipid-binding protein